MEIINHSELKYYSIFTIDSPDGLIGIMGLMHQDNQYFPNLIDESTDKQNQSFAICFNRQDPYMSIGLSDGSYSIPYKIDSQFYTIKILDIRSDGFIFDQDYFIRARIVLDSGSNAIGFGDKQTYDYFQFHFNQYISKNNQVITNLLHYQCVRRHNEQDSFFKVFPTYTFQLENGFEFRWQPQNYLRSEKGFYCFRISYYEGFPGILLGTPFMMGWELTFDQSSKQIHFTENCSCKQLKETLLKNIADTPILDIQKDEPRMIDLDTENSDEGDKSNTVEYLIIILVLFLMFMIISISYYLRRIKLIKNQQLEQKILMEVKSLKILEPTQG